MTIQDAIYCLSTYVPSSLEICEGCEYFKRHRCVNSAAHEMAIEALKKELVRSMPVIERDEIDELL